MYVYKSLSPDDINVVLFQAIKHNNVVFNTTFGTESNGIIINTASYADNESLYKSINYNFLNKDLTFNLEYYNIGNTLKNIANDYAVISIDKSYYQNNIVPGTVNFNGIIDDTIGNLYDTSYFNTINSTSFFQSILDSRLLSYWNFSDVIDNGIYNFVTKQYDGTSNDVEFGYHSSSYSGLWSARFNTTNSYIKFSNNSIHDIEDFAVVTYLHIQDKPISGTISDVNYNIISKQNGLGKYPFDIYYNPSKSTITADVFDGHQLYSTSVNISTGYSQSSGMSIPLIYQYSASNGIYLYNLNNSSSTTFNNLDSIDNNGNIYVGYNESSSNVARTDIDISKILIIKGNLTSTQRDYIKYNIISPFVGNVFYKSGILVLKNIKYIGNINLIDNNGTSLFSYSASWINSMLSSSNQISFDGNKDITEMEINCTISPSEYNYTYNPSVFINNNQQNGIKPKCTSSYFRPYITEIGLYNDNKELLVVGKLSQPIKKLDKLDLTFVVKYDL